MSSLIISIIGLGAVFYFGVLYGSKSLLLLAIALTALVVLAYLQILFFMLTTKVSAVIPIPLTECNRPVSVEMIAKSKFRFRPNKIKYRFVIRNYFTSKKHKVWAEDDRHVFRASEPGKYEIMISRVKIYDWTGCFCLPKRVRSAAAINIMPEVETVPVIVGMAVKNFFGDADVYDDFRPGYDPAEVFDVRDFRDGDKLQSVHWKLSAKSGELVVKENSLPKACAVTLLLNPKEAKSDMIGMLSYVTALSYSIMDKDCPHYVAWVSETRKQIVRARVDSEESFYMFMNYLLAEGIARGVDAKLEYNEKYRAERILRIIEIDEKNSIDKTIEIQL